ncbi:UvrB/UvrC motif-containing protein [Candidatus Daviesbacteria bacterium]|nr:UvrB/UvrC motif-containing protein [Candidatus Daviesbacteria bacterium]MBI2334691.1 UvrB/UvrC motif-containing protein [Candidatus Daviesbacteria bacterium]
MFGSNNPLPIILCCPDCNAKWRFDFKVFINSHSIIITQNLDFEAAARLRDQIKELSI